MRLAPWQIEKLIIGGVECTENMVGKYFDVKFILYDAETKSVGRERDRPGLVRQGDRGPGNYIRLLDRVNTPKQPWGKSNRFA